MATRSDQSRQSCDRRWCQQERDPLFQEIAGGNAKLAAALERAIPLGRLGEPSDLAGAVAFLASDDAAFVTGPDALREQRADDGVLMSRPVRRGLAGGNMSYVVAAIAAILLGIGR